MEEFQTRQTLLERVRSNHDEKSWEDFVHYYKNYIYIICRRMNLHHHDSEEVVQQVLVKLWEKIPTFDYDSRKRFRGWLCTVTGNTVKDFFRKQQSIRRKHDAVKEDEGSMPKTSGPDIEKIAEEEWQNYISTLAIEEVKKNFSSQVFTIFMKLHNGSSRMEVAEEYQLPPNTISVYKRRVLSAICGEIRRLEEDLT
jgi:RNA polymerase sigma factor (sigma-70 family)